MKRRTFLGALLGIPALAFLRPLFGKRYPKETVFAYNSNQEWAQRRDGSWEETGGSYQHGWYGPGPSRLMRVDLENGDHYYALESDLIQSGTKSDRVSYVGSPSYASRFRVQGGRSYVTGDLLPPQS